ncbi:MAG: hypothetical protein C5B49_16525 [Bdellovibrio sp.]|nr:MAG: hypothetical protein C5B49_16525 [Bdellovibrio sp.]
MFQGALALNKTRKVALQMFQLSTEETLQKQESDFKDWSHSVQWKILSRNCPKCGADVLCAYGDMGTTEFLDTYHHICMNSACDFIQKKSDFGIAMGARENTGPGPCPFCGRAI